MRYGNGMSPNSASPQPDAADSPESVKSEAVDAYARKLGLALLSVLRDKALLSDAEVQTILIAVNRSMRAERKAAETAGEDEPPSIDMEL